MAMLKTRQVNGVVFSPNGQPLSGAEITATLSAYEVDDGIIVPNKIRAVSDAMGEYTLELWPNELGINQTYYSIHILKVAPRCKPEIDESLTIVVPDGDGPVSLFSLIDKDVYPGFNGTLDLAKKYTDHREEVIRTDFALADDQVLAAAKQYTDQETSGAVTASNLYADSVGASTGAAANAYTDTAVDMTNAEVDVLSERVNALDQVSGLQRLHSDLIHPLKVNNIRLVGDSITWGTGATGASPPGELGTGPGQRNGTLTDPRNNLSCKCWSNLLRDWVGRAFAGGSLIEVLRDDSTSSGEGYYEITRVVDILGADFDYVQFKNSTKTFTRAEIVPTENASTLSGRYYDMYPASASSPNAVEFELIGDGLDVLYAQLSSGTAETTKVELWGNGVKLGEFSQYGSPAFGQSHSFTFPFDRYKMRLVNVSTAVAFRFEGLRFTKRVKVSNDGINGASTRSWINSVTLAESIQPDDEYVFMQIGTNDRAYHPTIPTNPFTLTKNLKQMVDIIGAETGGHAKVIMLSANAVTQDEMPYPSTSYVFDMRRVNQVIATVASELGLDFISQYEETMQMKIDGTSYLADGLHPNDAGYRVMFENIRTRIMNATTRFGGFFIG